MSHDNPQNQDEVTKAVPRFHLQRVEHGGERGPIEVVPVPSGDTLSGRRGFLSVAGVSAAAALGTLGCRRETSLRSPARVEPAQNTDSTLDKGPPSRKVGAPNEIPADDAPNESALTKPISLTKSRCAPLLATHTQAVEHVEFRHDGRQLASFGWDGKVKLWSVPQGTLDATISVPAFSAPMARYRANGSVVATGLLTGVVEMWNVRSGKSEATVRTVRRVSCLSFSPAGQWLAAGSENGAVVVWAADTLAEVIAIQSHTGWVHDIAFVPDGKHFVSLARSRGIELWSMTTGSLVAELEEQGATCVAISPDGQWIASGTKEGTVRLWDAATGTAISRLGSNLGPVWALAFGHDSASLVAGTDAGTIHMWAAPYEQAAAVLAGHEHAVKTIAFSDTGKWFASGSVDGSVNLWSPTSGELTAALEGHAEEVNTLAFSPSGEWLASGSADKTVRLWSVPRGASACLFDASALAKGRKARQVESTDVHGRVITHTLPCTSPTPSGATCVCNCVLGTHTRAPTLTPPPRRSRTRSSGSSHCSCNMVCTCVPVCQAHRLLDPDPVVAALARQILLTMGVNEVPYMEWAAATAPDPRTRGAVLTVLGAIRAGRGPIPADWPSVSDCLPRLRGTDEVGSILAAQGLEYAPDDIRGVSRRLSGVDRDRVARLLSLAEKRSAVVRDEVRAFQSLRVAQLQRTNHGE